MCDATRVGNCSWRTQQFPQTHSSLVIALNESCCRRLEGANEILAKLRHFAAAASFRTLQVKSALPFIVATLFPASLSALAAQLTDAKERSRQGMGFAGGSPQAHFPFRVG